MDAILYWNDVALEADRANHSSAEPDLGALGPVLAARALAIVHLAMHDAHAALTGGAPYLPGVVTGPVAGANVDAAVASAAHATLGALYPSQRATFARRHAEATIKGTGHREGHEVGLAVAAALLDDRRGDPGNDDAGHCCSSARGAHRADPDNPEQGALAPSYGARSRCFAVTARHQVDPPPRPGDPAYVRALDQVRRKGIAAELAGTVTAADRRTPEETLIGLFWAYDGAVGLGTPPRLYNRIVRRVAEAQGNGLAQNAELLARVNVAMADAGILAWEEKYRHDLWRPVVGIREDDPSMGPTGQPDNRLGPDCDPGWLPLGAPRTNARGRGVTPPFPAYPSGHATFGAAALQVVRRFYGQGAHGPDTLFAGLELVSEELDGVSRDGNGTVRPRHARSFPGGLWDMVIENGLSRVFLGVHWVFDAFAVDEDGEPDLASRVGGVPLGLRVADDIADHGLARSTVGPRAAGPTPA